MRVCVCLMVKETYTVLLLNLWLSNEFLMGEHSVFSAFITICCLICTVSWLQSLQSVILFNVNPSTVLNLFSEFCPNSLYKSYIKTLFCRSFQPWLCLLFVNFINGTGNTTSSTYIQLKHFFCWLQLLLFPSGNANRADNVLALKSHVSLCLSWDFSLPPSFIIFASFSLLSFRSSISISQDIMLNLWVNLMFSLCKHE